MNGKIQGIIVCGVIIACLGGTLAFLKMNGGNDNSSSTSDSSSVAEKKDESVLLIDSSADKISKVAVKSGHGEYTMVKSASGKTVWNIEELTGINQSSTLESGMAENIAGFEAYKTVEENAEDLEKYGLAEPEAEFTVTFTDDTQRTFYVGDVSTQSRYRYLCEKDDSSVYMMLNSKVSYFIDPVETFIDTSLIEKPSDDEMPDYGTLTVKRSDLDYDMVFEQDPYDKNAGVSAQTMIEPIFSYLNVTVSSETTHGMWGLSAETAAKIFPDEKDFKEYGLDKPLAEVIFKGDGYDYNLKIGKEIYKKNDNGEDTSEIASYYCYLTGVDGVDCIWEISADALPWATVLPSDVTSSLMTANVITDVSEVKVKTAKTDIAYALENDDENTNSVKMNGKEINVSQFQDLYRYIITCPTSEIYFDEVKGEPYMSIEIICSDGHSDKMEFYTDSSRRSIVALNGKPSFKIQSKWVDQLLENIDYVENGKDIIETY